MEYGISNLPTLSSDSKFTIFRTAVKGALASCGCPSYHTYLKWAGIVLGIISCLCGGLMFIPFFARGQWYNYLGAVYLILLGIFIVIYEQIIGRFLIYNYLVRAIMYLVLCAPCFITSLGGIPGVLLFVFSVLYLLSWLRFESGAPEYHEQIIEKQENEAL